MKVKNQQEERQCFKRFIYLILTQLNHRLGIIMIANSLKHLVSIVKLI